MSLKEYMQELINSIEIDASIQDEAINDCDICAGIGMVKLASNKPLVPCSACDKGKALAREIMTRKLNQTELPELYQGASLSRWLGDENLLSRKGKILAFLTCYEFVNHPEHLVSSHGVANRVRQVVPQVPAWIEDILSAPDSRRRGFVLQGPVGTGKTWLAAAVMNDLLEQGELVLYMRAQEIIQSLKDTWSDKDSREADVLNRYKTVPYLFIDDMNLELRGHDLLPHQKDYMEAIIRYRSNNRLHTFITCNIDNQQFYEQWGSRIADVITADLQWIKMAGEAFRDTSQLWGDL